MLMKLFDESEVLSAAFELRQAVRQVTLRIDRLSEAEKGSSNGCFCFASTKQVDAGAWGVVFEEGRSAFDHVLSKQQVSHAISGRMKQSISLTQLRNGGEVAREESPREPARSSLRLQATSPNQAQTVSSLDVALPVASLSSIHQETSWGGPSLLDASSPSLLPSISSLSCISRPRDSLFL